MKILSLLLCLALPLCAPAQDCPHYKRLMDKAKSLWAGGDFEAALNQLSAAREHCPVQTAEIDAQFVAFTSEIAKKYKEAERLKKRAEAAEKEAKKEADATRKALARSDSLYEVADAEKKRADSLFNKSIVAQNEAKQIALKSVKTIHLFNDKIENPDLFSDTQEEELENLKNELFKYAAAIKELLPFQDHYDGLWGYKDALGDLVILPLYDTAEVFIGDYARVKQGGNFYRIDKSGRLFIIESLEIPWEWVPLTAGMQIPRNAVPGNKASSFVCRCRYPKKEYSENNRTLPGGMHSGNIEKDSCHFGWGDKEIIMGDFEVLVINDTAEVRWVNKKEINGFLQSSGWMKVQSGFEGNGEAIYVVRAMKDNQWIPGKLWASQACVIPYKGGNEAIWDFEYLMVRIEKK